MNNKPLFVLAAFFTAPLAAFAWGGPEHSSITAAAVSVLSPTVLAFLGSEAARLIKIYCTYPDFNWAVYGTCSKTNNDTVRIPDVRRDFNAPFYCEFDEFTGAGGYYGHGPEIGNILPPPDEHSVDMFKHKRFNAAGISNALRRSQEAFVGNRYFDAIRLLGVALHYLEDGTPPPHTLAVPGGSNQLHHDMEKIDDLSRISAVGYTPRIIAATPEAALEAAAALSVSISLQARAAAETMLRLMEQGDKAQAETITIDCAQMAARAAADIITTMVELNQGNLPKRPQSPCGENLLFNPSFDLDENHDLLPDGWIREWHDLTCPWDMHLWDRVSTHGNGACARLYRTSEAGAAWRTARTSAIPVSPGQAYELSGQVRPQGATGSSFIAIRFQDATYETAAECRSPDISGSAPWQRVSVNGTAPPNAVDAIVVCASTANAGSILFDDMNLTRRG